MTSLLLYTKYGRIIIKTLESMVTIWQVTLFSDPTGSGWCPFKAVVLMLFMHGLHSGKSATIRESNNGSGVCKEHYT